MLNTRNNDYENLENVESYANDPTRRAFVLLNIREKNKREDSKLLLNIEKKEEKQKYFFMFNEELESSNPVKRVRIIMEHTKEELHNMFYRNDRLEIDFRDFFRLVGIHSPNHLINQAQSYHEPPCDSWKEGGISIQSAQVLVAYDSGNISHTMNELFLSNLEHCRTNYSWVA